MQWDILYACSQSIFTEYPDIRITYSILISFYHIIQMSSIEHQHHFMVSRVWENLQHTKKRTYHRSGPYDRIKLKRIGVPSVNSAVYEMYHEGTWVVKVTELSNDLKKVFELNNRFINDVLKMLKQTDAILAGHCQTNADMCTFHHREFIKYNGVEYAITFEECMNGETVLEYIQRIVQQFNSINQLDTQQKTEFANTHTGQLLDIVNKTKATMMHLYTTYGFNHNDMHTGNLFLKRKTDGSIQPVLFDFDWSAFYRDNTTIDNDIRKQMLKNMNFVYGILVINRILDHEQKIHALSCDMKYSWYDIMNQYCLLKSIKASDYTISVLPEEHVDLIMLLNDIFNHLCNNGIDSDIIKSNFVDSTKKTQTNDGFMKN